MSAFAWKGVGAGPRESIQYGKKTPRYARYHHPEVTLKDMLDTAPAGEESVG